MLIGQIATMVPPFAPNIFDRGLISIWVMFFLLFIGKTHFFKSKPKLHPTPANSKKEKMLSFLFFTIAELCDHQKTLILINIFSNTEKMGAMK